MSTTGPQSSPSISSNRCSARARSCAVPYGVPPRKSARPRRHAGAGLRLSPRGRDLLHVQLESRHPAVLRLEFAHHACAWLTRVSCMVACAPRIAIAQGRQRSEEHTSELQSPCNLVCRLLLEKKKNNL